MRRIERVRLDSKSEIPWLKPNKPVHSGKVKTAYGGFWITNDDAEKNRGGMANPARSALIENGRSFPRLGSKIPTRHRSFSEISSLKW
jgi:hypothetical protein